MGKSVARLGDRLEIRCTSPSTEAEQIPSFSRVCDIQYTIKRAFVHIKIATFLNFEKI